VSYVNLINKNVNFAFNAVKDLATTVVLTKKNVTGYDFGTKSNIENADTVISTKVVVINATKGNREDRKASERNTQKQAIMLKKEDVGDVSFYETVTIDSAIFQLGRTIKDDGFIVTVEAYKEI